MNLIITSLNSQHNRASFRSGIAQLDHYLHRQANQDIKRNISRVFVATAADDTATILGYYTLSSLAIEVSQLPADLANKLPRHAIPAALIGRLAVAQSVQNGGIGKILLVDAIKRTLSVCDEIAIYAMVVDAIDDNTKQFYQKYGFLNLSSAHNRLFLPLKNLSATC